MRWVMVACFLAFLGTQGGTTASAQDGAIVAWGGNWLNQCDVPALTNGFVGVAGGYEHSLGLKAEGVVLAWGSNYQGQCNVPSPNTGFVMVAAGYFHSLALKEDGTIVAWGENDDGQCQVPEPNSGFTAIAAGGYHSLALKEDGAIVAWGANWSGQCIVPPPNAGFVKIAAGSTHSLGLKADSTIAAWGDDYDGQCQVPEPNSGYTAIAGGYSHSLAVRSDGSVAAWGNNTYYQCTVPAPNAGFVAVAGGYQHSLGLRADSTIAAWGANFHGQCNIPAPNSDFVAMAAGLYHSLGLKAPAPAPGSCCYPDGSCLVTLETACAGVWTAAGACVPNSCQNPNANGVLWVHDTGIVYSTDLVQPVVSPPPADITGVDNEQPQDGIDRVWKVYAAFPTGSHPRLKSVGWGIDFPDAAASPYAYVGVLSTGCGLPHEDGPYTDIAITEFGFPTAGGGMIYQTFTTGPRITAVVELFYFTGRSYASPPGGPVTFHTVPYYQPDLGLFFSDAVPAISAPIAGYGSLGFGQAGETPCPSEGVPAGACCDHATGACEMTVELDCSFDWLGACVPCSAQTCTAASGSCCFPDGSCQVLASAACVTAGGTWTINGVCEPNPCPGSAAAPEGRIPGARLQVVAAPNPGTGSLAIHCLLPADARTTIVLFDASGRRVRRLHDGNLPAGETRLVWDGRDDSGREVPKGVYLVKAANAAGSATGRVVRAQ